MITRPQLRSIKSKGLDDNQKGTEVADLLIDKLEADETKAEERLESICKIFEHKKVASEKLSKIAAEMRQKLTLMSFPGK